MAIEIMQKVRLTTHKSISETVIDALQRLGCCQFVAQNHDRVAEKDVASLKASLKYFEDLLAEARFVMRFLEPYATEKGGGLAKALGDLPSLSTRELASLASEDEFLSISTKARNLEKRSSEARSGLSRVAGLIDSLSPLASLPYSLDFYNKGTDAVQGALLQVASTDTEEFKKVVESSLGSAAEVFVLPAEDGEKDAARIVSVVYSRSVAAAFQDAVGKFQTSRVDVQPQLTGLAAVELARLAVELADLNAEDKAVTDEITGIANGAYKRCQYCTDYWSILKAKLDAMIDGEQTEQIIVTSFWIPKNCVDTFRKVTAPYSELTEIEFVDPDEGEQPPTLLRNKGLAVPMEPLIEMYGIPTYGSYDPTAIVAPFFYAFFGICFGDAAYGLIIASLLIAILMKKNVTGTPRKFLQILILGNICALVFGALTFSWFGDSITAFPFLSFLAPLQKIQILDPMNDPMTMLYVSLAFGFVQILVGLLLAMRGNWRSGNKFAAIVDQGGWILFLCSLVLFGLASAGVVGVSPSIFKMAAIAGAVILVATQGREKPSIPGKILSGVLSLYNVSAYLGDLLSYSRLLALGLCSAAVGVVVNLLANLVSGVPFVGVILALLIFVVGHTFSIAVNVLGAFVHSLRLQYVEFFGKFHAADGVEFVPLSVSTQYVKLSD
jgi:V/A-type H+-transporting ATPase subunit I